jgi:hypothetical protein
MSATKRTGQDARDFGMALAILVKHYRKPDDFMDSQRVSIYEYGLDGVPGALCIRAAMQATKTRKWFPEVPELAADAEACRQELLASMPYEPCDECELTRGWVELKVDGVTRMTRCRCWKAYQSRLEAAGVTPKTALALPAASEFSQVGEQE